VGPVSRRVAYLTSQYPAASHTFIRREVEALREEDWTVETFSIRPPGRGEAANERDRAEEAGTFYVLRQSPLSFLAAHFASLLGSPGRYLSTLGLSLRHRAPGLRGLLLGLAHFAESALLARELKRRQVPHLHNHFANSAATVGLLASRLGGIGWSFTMHGISETDYPAGLMLGLKIEAAALVACVSWFGRAQGLRLVGPEHWHKVHVVRCGLPFDRLPARSTAGGDSKTIVCVGRLSPEKGQHGLFEAFAKLREAHTDVQLRLVGDGPDRASLEAHATHLGIADAVTFAGRLPEEETLAEIARSDLLVLPSFMEGLPIVLMEAMALGVPVVASQVAGIPELVEHGSTGLLFEPSNWADLAAKIERLLSDEQLYASIAANAPAKVKEEFDTRKSAARLSELFERPTGTIASC
jgi:glycosyltransferase involved in cell wall biosynthesis